MYGFKLEGDEWFKRFREEFKEERNAQTVYTDSLLT